MTRKQLLLGLFVWAPLGGIFGAWVGLWLRFGVLLAPYQFLYVLCSYPWPGPQ